MIQQNKALHNFSNDLFIYNSLIKEGNTHANTYLTVLERLQSSIQKSISKLPKGRLKIRLRPCGEPAYYHCYIKDNKIIDQYIPKKKNLQLAKDLAQKQYLQDLEKVIDEQINALNAKSYAYSPAQLYEVYEKLRIERQKLVEPLFLSPEQFAHRWNLEEYNKSKAFPERLIFETDKGDFVRSKSEVIIANYLHAKSDMLFYRYECPLQLTKPRPHTVYPDFTIISRSTGKIVYLEHCGMLDNPDYADDFVNKMNRYIVNGLMPGSNVILTAETSAKPLIIQSLWLQIETILNTSPACSQGFQ